MRFDYTQVFLLAWIIAFWVYHFLTYGKVEGKHERSVREKYGIRATWLARNECKATIVCNMIVLGALCKVTGVVGREALEQSITASVPKGKEDLNLTAFDIGFREVQAVSM